MKTIKLQQVSNTTKIGTECPYIEPNIKEDCLLEVDNEIIGFYINDISKYSILAPKYLAIANKEFRSDNVPKQEMSRGPQGNKADKAKRLAEGKNLVTQYSTILGSRAPKPHMRMPYPSITPVHSVDSAKVFIKAMFGACLEGEAILKKLTPHIYKRQVELFKDVKKEIDSYLDYWTEKSPNGKKCRFEKQKTFDVKRRMQRWMRNNYNKPKVSQTQHMMNVWQEARQIINGQD